MTKTLTDYLNEVEEKYDELSKKHSMNVALTLLNMAVTMRNTDNMNTNITANMSIKEEDKHDL